MVRKGNVEDGVNGETEPVELKRTEVGGPVMIKITGMLGGEEEADVLPLCRTGEGKQSLQKAILVGGFLGERARVWFGIVERPDGSLGEGSFGRGVSETSDLFDSGHHARVRNADLGGDGEDIWKALGPDGGDSGIGVAGRDDGWQRHFRLMFRTGWNDQGVRHSNRGRGNATRPGDQGQFRGVAFASPKSRQRSIKRGWRGRGERYIFGEGMREREGSNERRGDLWGERDNIKRAGRSGGRGKQIGSRVGGGDRFGGLLVQ